jgi:hypothetical protein
MVELKWVQCGWKKSHFNEIMCLDEIIDISENREYKWLVSYMNEMYHMCKLATKLDNKWIFFPSHANGVDMDGWNTLCRWKWISMMKLTTRVDAKKHGWNWWHG